MITYTTNHTPPSRERNRGRSNQQRAQVMAVRRGPSVKIRRTSKRKRLGLPSYESKEYAASQRRKKLYGIPELVFNSLSDGQGFQCAICKQTDEGKEGKAKTLQVDHCHATGWVRALLCQNCNILLGRAKDNPTVLEAAAAYLRFHNREGKLVVGPADSIAQ